ncbi:MAG TPA: choice-of-anchor tandem repeat GloVer-containing protein [Rhizomicrobium sp.]
MDKKGNLWGTATDGGQNGGGLIFKISSRGRESTIHTFLGQPSDGFAPYGAMVADSSGILYGTTFGGGSHGFGAVFKLAPDGTESLVYSFRGGRDGLDPFAGLIIDPQNNLYGTTDYGGKVSVCPEDFGGCGTVFRLSPSGTKTLLYKFKGPPNDGETVMSNVITDASGDFYGTTNGGGRAGCFSDKGCGVVFKLAPDGTETVLYYFAGEKSDGSNPAAGLVEDGAGNLYGTTEFGGGVAPCNGADGCGTVFKIAPDGTETILHFFGTGGHGATPLAGLVADGAGNFYGTAARGGAFGYGTVFEITP